MVQVVKFPAVPDAYAIKHLSLRTTGILSYPTLKFSVIQISLKPRIYDVKQVH